MYEICGLLRVGQEVERRKNQRTTETNRFVVKDVLCSFVGGQNSLKKIVGRNQTMEPLRPLLLGKDKDFRGLKPKTGKKKKTVFRKKKQPRTELGRIRPSRPAASARAQFVAPRGVYKAPPGPGASSQPARARPPYLFFRFFS
jgi:hypothetical protein